MSLTYRLVVPVMWILWAAYWWLASYTAKRTARREPLGSRLLHVLPLVLSVWLLASDRLTVPSWTHGCSRGRLGRSGPRP